MPGGDRRGPEGMGPKTGRALGYCSGSGQPGYMSGGYGRGMGYARGFFGGFAHGGGFGRGFRRGGGFGYRYGFAGSPVNENYPENAEVSALRRQVADLQNQLNELRNRN